MYLIIKHTEGNELPEDKAAQYLSDLVYHASGIENSSKLAFDCKLSKAGLEIWELPDNDFIPKLRGLAVIDVHPAKASPVAATDLSTIRYFKDAGADFANLWISLTGGSVSELRNLDVVQYCGEYIFFLSDPSVALELQELIHNLDNHYAKST